MLRLRLSEEKRYAFVRVPVTGRNQTSAVIAVTGVNNFGEGRTNNHETVGLLLRIDPPMMLSIIDQEFSCKPSPNPMPAPSLIGAGASSDLRGGLQGC